ncbi:hypothetical protein BKA63DRAFT_58364 [Paraphoma chrysanthemicola]|nr:hypothetical protein BKA63DRAFT_58364 [Paraphoma chrysanthemicola]
MHRYTLGTSLVWRLVAGDLHVDVVWKPFGGRTLDTVEWSVRLLASFVGRRIMPIRVRCPIVLILLISSGMNCARIAILAS